jgi:hypothetical protein
MFQGQYVFAQIAEFIPRREFNQSIINYHGNERIRNLDCRDQLLALMFGQLTNVRSLRGIVLCLNAHKNLLYHLGFKTNNFTLSTLSRANENRDYRIYHDLAERLIKQARRLYLSDNDFRVELDGAVYALDSTVIELCLTTFTWAYFKQEASAVKVHAQLDLRGNIPSFFLITNAKTHDVNFLDVLEFERGAFYIMDRGYLDFELRIEVFWGHSANAVKTQICIAMCTFLMVAIMKKQLKIDRNLYEILQILTPSQFEKTPINTLVSECELPIFNEQVQKQACLFDS